MRLRFTLSLIFVFAAALPVAAQDGEPTSREQAALAEEQKLLHRQLQRLETSMESLAERFETEGRVHAAGLLRKGLSHLERGDESSTSPLPELMNGVSDELLGGRVLQSIEQMEASVAGLERLLSILLDRPDVEELEERLQQLGDFKAALSELADDEGDLRKETEELKNDAGGEETKEFLERLRELREEQRSLLAETEASGRESGAIDLEALERDLIDLVADQSTDLAVLESEAAGAAQELEAAIAPLELERLEGARAARMRAAAEDLKKAIERLRAGEAAAASEELNRSANEAEKLARASNDPAAEQAATSLREASEALESALGDPQATEEAAALLEREASDLETFAEAHEGEREAAKATAQSELQEIAQSAETSAAAEAAREALELMQDSPETSDALEEVRQAAEASERLPEILARSERANAQRAQRIAEGIQRAPGEASEVEERALTEAQELLEEAAEQLESDDLEAAAEPARAALEALEEALGALQERREAQAGAATQQTAAKQSSLAEELQDVAQRSEEASVSPEARSEMEEALEKASEAMQAAAEALQESRPLSAAAEERRAMEAIDSALEAGEEGVQPETAEEQAKAEELAQRQEQLKKLMYELKNQLDEDDPTRDTSALERAQAAAAAAEQALQEGELAEAERQQEEAERSLREAAEELAEEEEAYQQLREEELLFKTIEEVNQILEAHTAQMKSTLELDLEREPGARPSRSQKLRLRRIAREEEALSVRSGEIAKALIEERSAVFGALVDGVRIDLERVARDLGDEGGYQSGARIQALQQDIEEALGWLLEALEEESQEEEEEEEEEEEGEEEEAPEGDAPQNRLVPDAAELRLLRRMERDVLDSVEELLLLHPELIDGGEVDPFLLEDVSRLGQRHERTSKLFSGFRERLGIPAPGEEPANTTENEGEDK